MDEDSFSFPWIVKKQFKDRQCMIIQTLIIYIVLLCVFVFACVSGRVCVCSFKYYQRACAHQREFRLLAMEVQQPLFCNPSIRTD